jgi:drug/metabolite transporter (DMT)-like permease
VAITLRISAGSGTVAGSLYCTAGMTIVGASVALAPVLSGYPVLAGQAWRYLLAGAVLLGALRVSGRRLGRPSRRELGLLILLAATGLAGFNWFLIEGARYADPAFLATVIGATPLVLAVAGPSFAGARIRPLTVAGGVVVASGIVLVQGATSAPLVAVPYAVGFVLCEAAFTLLAASLLRTMDPAHLTTAVCLVAVPLLAALAAVQPGPDLQVPTAREALVLLYMAVLTTATAFVLWYRGVVTLGADRAGLFTGVMPVAGVVASVVLGTAAWSASALGGAVLCAAGLLIGLGSARHIRSTQAARQSGGSNGLA